MEIIQIEEASDVPENFTGIVKYANGSKQWYLNGQCHREDGPAIEYNNGTKGWFKNGRLHREDGPAIEYAGGRKEWWVNGEKHREDGPAIEYHHDDTDFKSYFIHGCYFTKEEYEHFIKLFHMGYPKELINWLRENEKNKG